MVIVYVDDTLITGSSPTVILQLKQMLDTTFTIKDLGQIKYYLGLEVSRSSKGIFVHQRKYILDLRTDFVASGPMEQHIKLHDTISDHLSDASSYRCLIGKLQYLTMSRLDISYTVNHLSQFLQTPCQDHMTAALRVPRYLKGSIGMGLFFSSSTDLTLHAYSDSDWAGQNAGRRSISGYCMFLYSSLIS